MAETGQQRIEAILSSGITPASARRAPARAHAHLGKRRQRPGRDRRGRGARSGNHRRRVPRRRIAGIRPDPAAPYDSGSGGAAGKTKVLAVATSTTLRLRFSDIDARAIETIWNASHTVATQAWRRRGAPASAGWPISHFSPGFPRSRHCPAPAAAPGTRPALPRRQYRNRCAGAAIGHPARHQPRRDWRNDRPQLETPGRSGRRDCDSPAPLMWTPSPATPRAPCWTACGGQTTRRLHFSG